MHNVSSMTTWFAKVYVEQLECPAQNPDLNPHWTPLGRTGTQTAPTSAPDFTNAPAAVWTQIPTAAPQTSGKPSQKSGAYYTRKARLNLERDAQQARTSVFWPYSEGPLSSGDTSIHPKCENALKVGN